MSSDGNTFLKRARLFHHELKKQSYPNASTLASLSKCSRSTAVRCIERLRDEYGFPVEYDSSEKGYFLTNLAFDFQSLPPGKDELTALFLMRDLSRVIDAPDLRERLDNVWLSCVGSDSTLTRDLERLSEYFSSDLTSVSELSDLHVLALVNYAAVGEHVRITYQSPWRHTEEKTYDGKINKIHFSDGALYILFEELHREIILNATFVREIIVLPEPVKFDAKREKDDHNWLEGFGVWANEEMHTIEIEIAHPAAQYFAKQRWHVDEENVLTEQSLIKRFPSK